MMQLLTLLPWVLFALLVPLLVRRTPRLNGYRPPAPRDAPLVSVIVPARNEALNIGTCVVTLLDSSYPRFEVLVVDDGSEDGTGAIAQALAERGGGNLRVITGEPLPAGWFGKPWACWQGYRAARGELLLFTDADTRHDARLLGSAVAALQHEKADLVSIFPRQLLGSFWERVVMPQIMLVLLLRYGDLSRINRSGRPRDVIANGQFILVRREAYEAVGGHQVVGGEVAEDLRLAQHFVQRGRRIFLAYAEDLIETRMYRSLAGVVEGFSKNMAVGSRFVVASWLGPLVPWIAAAALLSLWVLPPSLLLAAWVAGFDGGVRGWAGAASGISLVPWLVLLLRLRVGPLYALAYPLGGALAAWICVRSALRGERITWKGRLYGERRATGR
ncbi:MAG: glycosyltransferase [Gemmatimonadetes bacterium]|nr:glycosyltransferase [Gemmatimonadota bacterium]